MGNSFWVVLVFAGIGVFLWYRWKQGKAAFHRMHELVEESKGDRAPEIATQFIGAGMIDDARRALLRGAQLGNISAANQLGMLIAAAREAGKYNDADRQAERWVKGSRPKILASFLSGADQPDQAIKVMRTAASAGGTEEKHDLAQFLLALGREAEGLQLLRDLHSRDYVPAAITLAFYHDERDHIRESVELFKYLRDKGATTEGVSLNDVIRQREAELASGMNPSLARTGA